MRQFSGKTVAITGAASGIGRALAVRLGAEGARLSLCDVDRAGLEETRRQVHGSPEVSLHEVDVASRDAVEAWARATLAEHGAVDVLVNNAAVSCVARVEDATHEDFAWVLDIGLWGVIHGVKAFLPLLREVPEAQIVNVGSLNSFVPFPTSAPYNIAKAGVESLSETLMMELADTAVSVSMVYPGGVKTNASRNARYTTPEDHAGFERRARHTADQAAAVIVDGMRRGRHHIYVGWDARLMALLRRLAPQLLLRLIAWGWRREARRASQLELDE